MAITAKRTYEIQGDVKRIPGKLAGNATYYQGQLLVIDGGYLAAPTDAANKVPIGIYDGFGADPETGKLVVANGATADGAALKGIVRVPFTNAAQTDVGLLFYMADNGTVTKTAGSKTWSVLCVGFETGYVWLDFDSLHGAAA